MIAYLGHDDLWLPGHLDALVAAIDDGARVAHTTTLGISPSGPPAAFPPPGWAYEAGVNIPPTSVAHERALIGAVGGWRPPHDTGDLEPEADLWQRMAAIGYTPRWVPRLTCVKLAAGHRRGVYKARPNHEQQYWLARIRESADPETSLLAACGEDYVFATHRRPRLTELARPRLDGLVRVVGPRLRVRTRLRGLGLLPPVKPPPAPPTAEQRWLATRRYKGIDD